MSELTKLLARMRNVQKEITRNFHRVNCKEMDPSVRAVYQEKLVFWQSKMECLLVRREEIFAALPKKAAAKRAATRRFRQKRTQLITRTILSRLTPTQPRS